MDELVTALLAGLRDDHGEPLAVDEILEGPWDVGSETRWRLTLGDGRTVVLAQLSPALAREQSLRRRWVRDVEQLAVSAASSVAPTLALGPQPDPRDPRADAPWRLRLDPEGESFATWISRAPVPIDELAQRGAALADALHLVHRAGSVVRMLRPSEIVWTSDQRVVLTDIGLARVDLLSSHTASSLLVSGSAYAAPEQLMHTVVDQRADLYSLGVILWQAALGALPFGDGPALLRERVALPEIHTLRSDAPPVLDVLLQRCLAEDPKDRPESAAEVAWVLRGGAGDGLTQVEATVCQHCGAPLRLGQRLCLACGRLGVRFKHQSDPRGRSWAVELRTLSEDADSLTELHGFIDSVAAGPRIRDEFVIGDVALYSEQELVKRKRLPARLFNHLSRETAEQLCERMRGLGLDAHLVRPASSARWMSAAVFSALGTILGTSVLGGLGGIAMAGVVVTGVLATLFSASRASSNAAEAKTRPLYRLRSQPAALPASDPLVARMAALLQSSPGGRTPADVRALLGELALLIQRLIDRRAELTGLVEASEFAFLTAPVEPLVAQLELRVAELARLDLELADLDEVAMVRQLGAIDARIADPGKRSLERGRLLDGLDRLRGIEDRRTATFHGLLEAATLLRRACGLGLGVQDPAGDQQRQLALALAALEGPSTASVSDGTLRGIAASEG